MGHVGWGRTQENTGVLGSLLRIYLFGFDSDEDAVRWNALVLCTLQ